MLHFLLYALLIASYVFADINILAPVKDATFSPAAGATAVSIELEWIDSGSYPTMNDITYLSFVLEQGPNSSIEPVGTLAQKIPPSAVTKDSSNNYFYTVTVDGTLIGDGQYYIQIYAVVDGAGNTIHYTPRFTLKGMKAAKSNTYTDTVEPTPQTAININTDITTTAPTEVIDTSASFSVPYYSQTGSARFAPMQTPPGSLITATSWSRRFPTSEVTYYGSHRNSLDQITTVTQGWSGSLTSDYNYATPALHPSDNGGWYNPRDRISLSVRKLNRKS
ncbi:hypothetical protein TBLA_0J01080 [Henningerozyma blattae CBS 6284]|uniref:Uncharacterized protein n=1 Tax=Henningerozyma blattae (strain ATCC 34711 / CBS 6284 / DSM 70876 / NBRC 10599 / NRRL Y-10934 / UCD 77-7) TaxID=1071380 RepID=I2H9Q4_HENB6|nr:hypothetical protein TBLA_0J01080 [Tetrapisispora blattae CBS 6284]CCH63106.1 hypothetical protein TBLA_0J01080 [Tetrapisispora blattae CBS 6284]